MSKVKRHATRNYEDLLVELLEGGSMEEYLAIRLHEAMDGVGTDEGAVLETLISSTNDEINAIKTFFYTGQRQGQRQHENQTSLESMVG